MKRIGLIVAVEMKSLKKIFGNSHKEYKIGGCEIHQYDFDKNILYVCESGAGEIAAAGATQLLISEFKVDIIMNFGAAGGLVKEVKTFDNCIVKNVVHHDYDITDMEGYKPGQYLFKDDIFFSTDENLMNIAMKLDPDLVSVDCASGDKFITEKKRRIEYAQKFKCQICEMEAAGVLLTCRRNNIPCLIVKNISDSIEEVADHYFEQEDIASQNCFKLAKALVDVL